MIKSDQHFSLGALSHENQKNLTLDRLFFNVGPTNVGHLFDHILWSIFQSVVTHNKLLKIVGLSVQTSGNSICNTKFRKNL